MGMGKDLCQGKDILLVIIHLFLGVPVSPAIQQLDQQRLVSDSSTYLNSSRLLGRMDSMIYILRRAMELVTCLFCCSYSCSCHIYIYPLYIHYISIIYPLYIHYISIIEGSLEVKLPTIWTVEKQR